MSYNTFVDMSDCIESEKKNRFIKKGQVSDLLTAASPHQRPLLDLAVFLSLELLKKPSIKEAHI